MTLFVPFHIVEAALFMPFQIVEAALLVSLQLFGMTHVCSFQLFEVAHIASHLCEFAIPRMPCSLAELLYSVTDDYGVDLMLR